MPDRLGAGEHLAFEIGRAHPAAGRCEVEQRAGPQRGVGDNDAAGRRFRQQRPVDQQRRNQRLRFDRRQAEAIDQLLFVQALDRITKREKRLPRYRPHAVAGFAVGNLRGRESYVPAHHDHVGDPVERDFESNLVDDVGNRSFQQGELDIVGQTPQVELLTEPHRAQRVDAGAVGLSFPEQRQARAAAAHLGQQGPGAANRGAAPEHLSHGEEDQTALLGFVDDLEGNTGAPLHPVEEHIAVPRLTNSAGGHRSHRVNTVAVNHAAEVLERRQGGIDGLRPDGAGGKRVAAEQHTSRGFLDGADRSVGRDLRDHQTNGARTHIEHCHEPWRRCRHVGGRRIGVGAGVRLMVGHNTGKRSTIAKRTCDPQIFIEPESATSSARKRARAVRL